MLKSVYEKVSIYAFKITFSDKNENVYANLLFRRQMRRYCLVWSIDPVNSKPRMRIKNKKEHDCYQELALREVASEELRFKLTI